ncbi:putative bifunctional diguanylate cyclase/phosphodiesterase [Bacillus sp. USDA818B3_A]|uniref:putative bifunctional diguanylate cyclase/phosphodiesterase n=1 Tax=Bacillus sp. USDA818B3_A TaxID=2698834 RepID=UPI001368A91A|nr:EAL domain-containing protein [Bacillus sp. USDA818B3_A]
MNKLYNEEFELETNLSRAIKENEFELHYQPKLDLHTGKFSGVEALIRWRHPEKGMIFPMDFIPTAEKTGRILEIGDWVLYTACIQNKKWQEEGLPSWIMAVNLSAQQLYQPNLVEKIQDILNSTGLSPEYLELEITESMMVDVQKVLPIIKDLKGIGVRISLDDFGTGYSSLYYLKEFPIDVVKIDKSFVRNCTLYTKDSTIIKAIIAMAHELGMGVIAEGVETKEQLIFLQQQHCDRGQGYLFSRPLPAHELVNAYRTVEQTIHRDGKPEEMATMQLAVNHDGGTLLVKTYMHLDKVQNIVKNLMDENTLSIYGNRIYGLRGTAFIEIHKKGRVLMIHSSEKGIVSYLHKKLTVSFENVEQSAIEDIIRIE